MKEIISGTIKLINDKVQFSGTSRDNQPVLMDYHAPIGDDNGYTGLELLLISLCGCSASAIVPTLRKMKATINSFEVKAVGERRDTHPTVLTYITLKFILTSPDTSEEIFAKAIRLAEETYCPVWAMLKNSVIIKSEYEIIKGSL